MERVAVTLETLTNAAALVDARVRRLTPVECERLMGLPDNWTRVPYRNRPADRCPDGPRYKACGNGVVVNEVFWLGQRLQHFHSQLERAAA